MYILIDTRILEQVFKIHKTNKIAETMPRTMLKTSLIYLKSMEVKIKNNTFTVILYFEIPTQVYKL